MIRRLVRASVPQLLELRQGLESEAVEFLLELVQVRAILVRLAQCVPHLVRVSAVAGSR